MLYFLVGLLLFLIGLNVWFAMQVQDARRELRDLERQGQATMHELKSAKGELQASHRELENFKESGIGLTAEEVRLMQEATPLVGHHEINMLSASGEAKRHQVYSRMIKLNPEANKSSIALAIELAIRAAR